MLKEFREFAMRGNVVDMAIGIIIGAAFGQIVNSMVADVLMPPVGMLVGSVGFSDLAVTLREAGPTRTAVVISYGKFLNTVIQFVVVAFACFLLVKQMNRVLRSEQQAAPAEPTTKSCPHCFSTIPIKATRCPQCTSELGQRG